MLLRLGRVRVVITVEGQQHYVVAYHVGEASRIRIKGVAEILLSITQRGSDSRRLTR